MKAILLSIVSAAALVQAEDLTTRSGKEYKDIKVTGVEVDALKISHAAGLVRVPFEELPAELQSKYAFDPAKMEKARAEKRDAKDQAVRAALDAEAQKKQSAADVARLAKLDWRYQAIKVARVLPDGLLCYPHTKGGAVGGAVRAMNRLTGNSANDVIRPQTDYSHLMFVEGAKGKWAEGDVLDGYGARDGVKEIDGRTYPRWISKPDNVPLPKKN